MNTIPQLEVWFVTGSQHLYGEETLRQVADNSQQIVDGLNKGAALPYKLVYKPVVTSPEAIRRLALEANNTPECAGWICWMHTFSPAKMWIGGLTSLKVPMLHLHTQFNRDLPWDSIDMDFMNLNQSAHGDREFGFINSRLRKERKVVAGHWQDKKVQSRIDAWMRAAAAWKDWQGGRFARFGDNMRQVAVTDGDKVAAEIRFGFTVDGFGIGDLVERMNAVSDDAIDALIRTYLKEYDVADELKPGGARTESLRESARIELGIRAFLEEGNYKGFTTTFEDLHGMPQLPGFAVQRLMADGYGFAGEGDWKTAALVRAMKVMASGLEGGVSFMEDYTYHLAEGDEKVLGSHMLEICPSISAEKPRVEIHPLSIGGKPDPLRLVFDAKGGTKALNASIVDLGNRFRLLVNTVETSKPEPLPKLPVARAVWKPYPDFHTGCEAWILAGGAHHTGYSPALTPEHLEDFASMAETEFFLIDEETTLRGAKKELQWNDLYFQLAHGLGHS